MIVISNFLQQCLPQFLKQLFLRRNNSLAYFIYIQQIFQIFLYITELNQLGFNDQVFYYTSNKGLAFSVILISSLILRMIHGTMTIKIIYPPILFSIMRYMKDNGNSSVGLIMMLIIILLIIQLISNISFDFLGESINSQSCNLTKVLHSIIIPFGIIYSAGWPQIQLLHYIFGGLFLGMFILKKTSIARDDGFKQFIMRSYLYMAINHLFIPLCDMFQIQTTVQIFVPLLVSQILFFIYKLKQAIPKLDQLYSQQKYLKLSYEVLKYIHGRNFDQSMEKQISDLIGQSITDIRKSSWKKNKIHQKLMTILAKQDQFQNHIILSQICIVHRHQLLKSRHEMQHAKKKLGRFDIIGKLLIYRLYQQFRQAYVRKRQQVYFPHYSQYFQCNDFRSLLLRASICCVNFWQQGGKVQVQTQKMRKLGSNLVEMESQINSSYKEMKVKCMTITILYVSYLQQVARDPTKAAQIMELLVFNEDFQFNFQINEKIFIRVCVQQSPIRIQKVGENISLLLGFDRKDIQGQSNQLFLPQFFIPNHRIKVQQLFESNFEKMHLLRKKSIIKNNYGYYDECYFMLRLRLQLDGIIRIQGYVQIKNNPKYHFNNYFFLNQRKQFVECCESLSDFAPTTTKVHRVSQFFNQCKSIYQQLIHYDQKNIPIHYHPLLIFDIQNGQKVVFFARLSDQQYENNENSIMQANKMKIINMVTKIKQIKFQFQIIKKYYLSLQQVIYSIFIHHYVVLATVSVLCVIGILTAEGLLFSAIQLKQQAQTNIFSTCTQLVNYLSQSIKLGMDLNYVDLSEQTTYTNNFTQTQILNLSLSLQTYNQKFKSYATNVYSLPSLIPNVTYQSNNFKLVTQFFTDAYLTIVLNSDPFLRQQALIRQRLSLGVLFGLSLGQYRDNYIADLYKTVMPDTNINIICLGVIIVLLVLVYVIIIITQGKLRKNQEQTLSLVTSFSQKYDIVINAKNFICKITREQINFNIKSNMNKNMLQTNSNKDISKSIISARELSGRNLMQDSFHNRSGLQSPAGYSGGNSRNQIINQVLSANINQKSQVKIRDKNRKIMVIPIIFAVIIIGLILTNHIINNITRNIVEADSVTNIFLLLKKATYFSRSSITLFNLINQKLSNYDLYSEPFTKIVNQNAAMQIVSFKQTTFAQFSSFQQDLTKIQYTYLCTYVKCDSRFEQQINIIYSITIQKLIKLIEAYAETLQTSNTTYIKDQINNNQTVLNFFNMIYYTEQIIRSQIFKVYETYTKCFLQYSVNMSNSKQQFIIATLVISVIGFIFIILLWIYVVKNQNQLKCIANIVKTDSYINQNLRLENNNLTKSTEQQN